MLLPVKKSFSRWARADGDGVSFPRVTRAGLSRKGTWYQTRQGKLIPAVITFAILNGKWSPKADAFPSRQRYNPELQRRSLRNRAEKQQEFDDFVGRLKVAAKSDKNIWGAIADIEAEKRQESKDATEHQKPSTIAELERRKREMKTSPGG